MGLLLFQVSNARLLCIRVLLSLAQALLAGVQLLCQSLHKKMPVKWPKRTCGGTQESTFMLSPSKDASSATQVLAMYIGLGENAVASHRSAALDPAPQWMLRRSTLM